MYKMVIPVEKNSKEGKITVRRGYIVAAVSKRWQPIRLIKDRRLWEVVEYQHIVCDVYVTVTVLTL